MFGSVLRRGWLACATILIVLPAPVLWPSPALARKPAALIVAYDPGGELAARKRSIRSLRQSGQRVELRGSCYSSCVMYLGLDNICVAPGARFGFHGPRAMIGALDRDVFEYWSQEMARDLRPPLRDWFLREARHIRVGLARMRGTELIAMGYPACGPSAPAGQGQSASGSSG